MKGFLRTHRGANYQIKQKAACALLLLVANIAGAGSAVWDLNPTSGDWNTATNWTPATVPNGSADAAAFVLSNTTNIAISADTEVSGITFTAAAVNSYTITASPGLTLTISGAGITNNSGTTQDFVTAVNSAGSAGAIKFIKSATAGNGTAFTNKGATRSLVNGGFVEFFNSSTAGSGSFTNNGSANPDAGGGYVVFNDTSSAGNGVFTNEAGTTRGIGVAGGGGTFFQDSSTAGNATFVNNAGFGQFGRTSFSDTSTAGNATITNNAGNQSSFEGSFTTFGGTSTAGNATINNDGGGRPGITDFGQNSSAGSAIINNNSGTFGGTTLFDGTVGGPPSAGSATINNNGATVAGEQGGLTQFFTFLELPYSAAPTAGDATINNNGGTVSGAGGGKTIFESVSTAGNSTLIANGGTNGGEGGTILFEEKSTGGTSRVGVFGNGNLDISFLSFPSPPRNSTTVGSIEGDGDIFLGSKNLTVGSNNRSTTFSGVIQDGGENGGIGGSLTKIGSGMLDLTGANTYTGNTSVKGGVLQVDGSINSNTSVHIRGTLAGTGTINGNVTSNRWGKVSPGDASGMPGLLTAGNYTQTQYATLMIQIEGASVGQFSVLDVLGNANLNGFLDPVLLNGFVPTIGDSFTFLDSASLSGEFSHINHQVFDNGVLQWSVTYQGTDAILSVGPNTIPDQGSTLLLLMSGLLGLVVYRQQLLRGQP